MDDRLHAGPRVDQWGAPRELAERVGAGRPLPRVASPVLLDGGEVAHAVLEADGWRYTSAEVVYDQRSVVAGGGSLLFGVALAATVWGNRRARAEAARAAVAQWRPLGRLRVVATDRRLLVLHGGAWASVWLGSVRQLSPCAAAKRLELVFEDDPPYALAGPWVPYLAVVVAAVLAEQRGWL